MGYRYSPPPYPPSHTPGTPSPPHHCYPLCRTAESDVLNMVVGLRSVGQLTLDDQISGLRVFTEVYNLLRIGRISDHKYIPGNK